MALSAWTCFKFRTTRAIYATHLRSVRCLDAKSATKTISVSEALATEAAVHEVASGTFDRHARARGARDDRKPRP